MSKFMIFISGIVVGVYIDQTYTLPRISSIINKINNDIKKYEKK